MPAKFRLCGVDDVGTGNFSLEAWKIYIFTSLFCLFLSCNLVWSEPVLAEEQFTRVVLCALRDTWVVKYHAMPQEQLSLPRIVDNRLDYLLKATRTINNQLPPTALLTDSSIIVGHNVDFDRNHRKTYMASIVGYVVLGVEPYMLLKTLAETTGKEDAPLKIVIPNVADQNTILDALEPELLSLKRSIDLAPLATWPIWVALDASPLTLVTPPGFETVVGPAMTFLLSQLFWARNIRGAIKKFNQGDVEFIEKPELQAVQDFLQDQDYENALNILSQCTGLYALDTLNLAEMIILSEQPEDGITQKAKALAYSFKKNFQRRKI